MKVTALFVLFSFLPSALIGCSGRRVRSPMRNQSLQSVRQLRVGVFDFSEVMDRSGIEKCVQEYPAILIMGESAVHRAARNAGVTPEVILSWGDIFENYRGLEGFDLLLMAYQQKGKAYLRMVNFLGQYASTVILDVSQPACRDILQAQRMISIDSHPPYADIQIDGRKIGEAPLWTWLRDGQYQLKCELDGDVFNPVELRVPQETSKLCRRENIDPQKREATKDKMSAEEKGGAVLIWIAGLAASAAAIALPVWLLFFR